MTSKQATLKNFFVSKNKTSSDTENSSAASDTTATARVDKTVSDTRSKPSLSEADTSISSMKRDRSRSISESKSECKIYLKRKKTYLFCESWKVGREWLMYRESEKTMFCTFCQKHDKSGRQNSFRIGCASMRLHEIKVHENSELHKRSANSELASICSASKLPLEQAVMNIDCKNTDILLRLFKVAYYIAINEKPYTDFPKVLDLLKSLGVDVGHSYATDKKAREFITCINETILKTLVSELRSAEYFSVLCDGTTDVSTCEQEIMFIRYVHGGKPKSVFVCVSSVVKADAAHIKEAIVEMFTSKLGYGPTEWQTSLVGVCFDGASVMMGCRSGVAVRLKTFVPHLLGFHCCAHRLELVVKDAAKSSPYMSVIDNVLYDIYGFYKYSANRWAGLQAAAEALNVRLLRPVKVSGVRWLPHHERAIKAVHQSYDALVTHLENEAKAGNKDNQEKSRKLLMNLQTVKFVMFINFYIVLLGMLSKLSCLFQEDSSGLHNVHDAVEATSMSLNNLSDTEGLKATMMKDITVMEVAGKPEYSFKGHVLGVPERVSNRSRKIVALEDEVEAAVLEAQTIVTSIGENIASRFDDHVSDEVSANSHVLNPEYWPDDHESLSTFGDEEIKQLFDHFERPLTSKGYSYENTCSQWTSAKIQILKLRRFAPNLGYIGVWEKMAMSSSMNSQHGDLLALVRIILSLPVNTAICERGFSLLKRVKTDWRSKLTPSSLSDLMSIQINGPGIENFEPDAAVALWMGRTRRYTRHPYKKGQDQKVKESEVDQNLDAWSSDSDESGPETSDF